MWVIRNWWQLPAIVAVVIVVQVWWSRQYDLPGGHASDHFMNASAVFGFSVAIAVLLWAVPSQERKQPVLWCLAAIVLAAALTITVANVHIVDAIGPENWSDAQASSLGPSRPGFTAGHTLADRAGLVISGAALLLVGWMAWRRAVNAVVVGVAAVACVIGGLGVFVLAFATVVRRARARAHRTDADPAPLASDTARP